MQIMLSQNQMAYTVSGFCSIISLFAMDSWLGANLESKMLHSFCNLTAMRNTRSTHYHSLMNGMVESVRLGSLNTQSKSQRGG